MDCAWREAIWEDTESADSRDIPSVMVPPFPPPVVSSASISTSAMPPEVVFCVEEFEFRPDILNTALSLPGPMPPRNLNAGAGACEALDADGGGREM